MLLSVVLAGGLLEPAWACPNRSIAGRVRHARLARKRHQTRSEAGVFACPAKCTEGARPRQVLPLPRCLCWAAHRAALQLAPLPLPRPRAPCRARPALLPAGAGRRQLGGGGASQGAPRGGLWLPRQPVRRRIGGQHRPCMSRPGRLAQRAPAAAWAERWSPFDLEIGSGWEPLRQCGPHCFASAHCCMRWDHSRSFGLSPMNSHGKLAR